MRSFLVPLLVAAAAHGDIIKSRQSPSNGMQCGQSMCVSGTVNGSNVDYVLTSRGTDSANVGWMAIGFGTHMIGSPLVVTWRNPDGTATLSQRMATEHVQPTVDPNPPRVATLIDSLTSVSGNKLTIGFSLPADGQTGMQDIIYAFSNKPPSSSNGDAQISMHTDKGTLQLQLAQVTSEAATSTSSTTKETLSIAPTPTLTPPTIPTASTSLTVTTTSLNAASPSPQPTSGASQIGIPCTAFSVVAFLLFLPYGY